MTILVIGIAGTVVSLAKKEGAQVSGDLGDEFERRGGKLYQE